LRTVHETEIVTGMTAAVAIVIDMAVEMIVDPVEIRVRGMTVGEAETTGAGMIDLENDIDRVADHVTEKTRTEIALARVVRILTVQAAISCQRRIRVISAADHGIEVEVEVRAGRVRRAEAAVQVLNTVDASGAKNAIARSRHPMLPKSKKLGPEIDRLMIDRNERSITSYSTAW